MDTLFSLDRALAPAGELLARREQAVAIVIVGGTAASAWIRDQDPSPAMTQTVQRVVAYVRAQGR